MDIEYLHASVYGNGARVPDGFRGRMGRPVRDIGVSATWIKGPLEEGWEKKAEAFVARIPVQGAATPDRA